MKTPEQILDEVAAENMINIQQMVTTKQLAITAIRRYARIYHQSKVENLGISGVSKRYFLFGCLNADKQKLNKLIIADDKETAIADLETSHPYIENWYTIEELNVC